MRTWAAPWIVVLMLHETVMAFGPLPYDIGECRRRIGVHVPDLRRSFALYARRNHKPVHHRSVSARDVTIRCETRTAAPVVTLPLDTMN